MEIKSGDNSSKPHKSTWSLTDHRIRSKVNKEIAMSKFQTLSIIQVFAKTFQNLTAERIEKIAFKSLSTLKRFTFFLCTEKGNTEGEEKNITFVWL